MNFEGLNVLGRIPFGSRPIPSHFTRLLKWYYDENHMFFIEAMLRHKQVAYMRRKMLFTIFKYLFLFQRYSNFKNVQISLVMT